MGKTQAPAIAFTAAASFLLGQASFADEAAALTRARRVIEALDGSAQRP